MSTIQEIYHNFIQPLPSTDRLNLATLILNKLVQQNASTIDQRSDWTEEDEADIFGFIGVGYCLSATLRVRLRSPTRSAASEKILTGSIISRSILSDSESSSEREL
jgi:hypothetical protein